MKKPFILILIFLLPVIGIIIFNFFSSSHFDIDLYYQDSVPDLHGCSEIRPPYHISKEIALLSKDGHTLHPFDKKVIKIFAFRQDGDFYLSEMNKVTDEFYDTDDVGVYLSDSLENKTKIPISERIIEVKPDEINSNELYKCVFLFDKDQQNNAVLVDKENRIRGYYNLLKREQTDSLIIETKILIRDNE